MAKPLCALPKRTQIFTERHIKLLNKNVPLALLEDSWRIPGQSDLWHYHLHYFEDTVAENAASRRSQHHRIIADWITKNPPITPVAWDAYPISRRSCYWMLAECAEAGLLNEVSLHSLANQLRFLSAHLEKHILANHLFANLKALWIGGCFFEGAEATQWRNQAANLLKRELAEQFLPDGAHCEIAPMYHALMLEDLLDIINIAEAFAIAPPRGAREIVPRALRYLQHVTHPDGALAHFHDTAQHIAPSTSALVAYAARFGLEPEPLNLPHVIQRLKKGQWCVLFDAASHGPAYQPGHTHAGFLATEISYAGQRVFVNQGTSSYACGERRSYERGTAAHNTLVLDGQNSCDVWASFRIGKRATLYGMRRIEAAEDMVIASAAHDGYRPAIHTRHLELEESALRIIDTLEGEGEHDVAVYLHGAPGVKLSRTHATLPDGTRLAIKGWGDAELLSTKHGRSFHDRVETESLVFRGRVCLPWDATITLHKDSA